ncbi:MAG: bifunctional nuclease family protein [Candidatus Omnitrophica bacterium]|nr:bifunctional nuclease family protein [Candidatus Omnitrophota bacterium]
MMKKADIFSLAMVLQAGQYLITLSETGGSRLLPIWIGPAEGMAIATVLNKQDFPRPLTHDLLVEFIKLSKAEIEKVVITDIKEDTYYAAIVLRSGEKVYNIDARPSDSIAVAVRVKAPIYIEERVFEKCPKIHKPITEKEVTEFKKKLANLRPEDFFRAPGKP